MPIDDSELDQIGQYRLPTPVPPTCPQCGYNLTGLHEPPCPECGYPFDWRSVRKKARMQWLEALGLKTLPEEIEFGFRLGWIAWGLAIMLRFAVAVVGAQYCVLDTLFLLMYSMEVFLAFCGAFLCSHIIRFRRLPQEAREELGIEVPTTKAWVGLAACVLLLVVSVPTCVRALL